ncbi:MAG: hypothetical protein SV422_01440 [Pseudomonadota bacterium]|nr:hypothetical protein [Pseudomonadota bacterium]
MKGWIRELASAVVCALCTNVAWAQVVIADPPQTTVFKEPQEYCFAQTSLTPELNDLGSHYLRFSYHLLVGEEHQGRPGDIYVGARFRNRPDEWWLFSGAVWRNAQHPTVPWPTAYVRFDDKLPAIWPVSLWYDPEALASLGEGEIWIGYGLRDDPVPTQQAFQESFDEMLRSRRYSLFWEIKPEATPRPGKLHAESSTICLKATEMTRTVFR